MPPCAATVCERVGNTFVRHADPTDAIRRLGWIAGDHGRRENVRVAAVHHMAKLGGGEQVGQLAGQLLVCPMLDDHNVAEPGEAPLEWATWGRTSNLTGWTALLGDARGGPDVSPYAAPARAEDLSGLPPAFINTCQFDPLRDEGIAYAQRLAQANVPTELVLYPGTFHGSRLIQGARITQQMVADENRAIVRRLGITPRSTHQTLTS